MSPLSMMLRRPRPFFFPGLPGKNLWGDTSADMGGGRAATHAQVLSNGV